MAELYSIVIGAGIYMYSWNLRRFLESSHLLVLGIAYLCVAILDTQHLLAFEGMGVFNTTTGVNLSCQFWIAARYVEAGALLVTPLFIGRCVKPFWIFAVCFAVTVTLLLLISSGVFPACYIEGVGLTSFKKLSEYTICLFLAASMILLIKHRNEVERVFFILMTLSICTTIASELFFTLYHTVRDFPIILGHLLKLCSFCLIYEVIVKYGLEKPHTLLYRNLKHSEEALLAERNRLQAALQQVKTLKGLLPICYICKRIRDDAGYWKQVDSYIKDHSEVQFTHGLCPSCAEDLEQSPRPKATASA
jgi:hypothetical protein